MTREERKAQYVETGSNIGGFLGGVIFFLAPIAAWLPKGVWVGLAMTIAAALGFGTRGVVEPAKSPQQSDTAIVALVGVVKGLEAKVDKVSSGTEKLSGTLDTVVIQLALVRRAIVKTEAGRRAIRQLEEERRAERSLQGLAPFNPKMGVTAYDLSGNGPMWRAN